MFERMSTTRLRLTKDARDQLASLLIVIRNECIAGASLARDETVILGEECIVGSAVNYGKQVEAIDRIITRLTQSFDVTKLSNGYNIFARAITNANGERLASRHIEEATNYYGSIRPDTGGDRIESKGDDKLSGEAGTGIDGPINSDRSGGESHPYYVDARPGRQDADTSDNQRATTGYPDIISTDP